MELFLWQIVFVVSIFMAVIICCLIPILLMRNTHMDSVSFSYSRLLSWCNCFTGGVFLAMCFLGLVPNVHQETMAVLEGFQWRTTFPLAECIVLMAFFIVLAIDQVGRHYENPKAAMVRHKVIEMNSLGTDDYEDDDVHGQSGVDDHDARCTLLYEDENETATDHLTAYNEDDQMDMGKYNNAVENGGRGTDLGRGRAQSSRGRQLDVSKSSSGHCHSHEDVINLMETAPRGLRFFVLLFALSMHALFEGIVLGLQRDVPQAVHLFTAIILHEAIVAATLGFNIAKAKQSTWTAVRYSLLFSVTIPIGIGLGMGIGQTPGTVGHLISGSLQGIAAGIFLHITFMQLLPDEFAQGKDGVLKTLFLFIGFLLLMTLNLLMGSEHLKAG